MEFDDKLFCPQCHWRGTVWDQDAGNTVCGCCPNCGNEDLQFVSEMTRQEYGKRAFQIGLTLLMNVLRPKLR